MEVPYKCEEASDSLLSWTEVLFFALEITHVLLLSLAYSTFCTKMDFAFLEPLLILEAPNALLHTVCGISSSHCLVPSFVRCSGNDLPKA